MDMSPEAIGWNGGLGQGQGKETVSGYYWSSYRIPAITTLGAVGLGVLSPLHPEWVQCSHHSGCSAIRRMKWQLCVKHLAPSTQLILSEC